MRLNAGVGPLMATREPQVTHGGWALARVQGDKVQHAEQMAMAAVELQSANHSTVDASDLTKLAEQVRAIRSQAWNTEEEASLMEALRSSAHFSYAMCVCTCSLCRIWISCIARSTRWRRPWLNPGSIRSGKA